MMFWRGFFAGVIATLVVTLTWWGFQPQPWTLTQGSELDGFFHVRYVNNFGKHIDKRYADLNK